MNEIQRFRTDVKQLTWTHFVTGEMGSHGSTGSGAFHHELKVIIDNSNSLEEFNKGVIELRDRWSIDPSLLPDLPTN